MLVLALCDTYSRSSASLSLGLVCARTYSGGGAKRRKSTHPDPDPHSPSPPLWTREHAPRIPCAHTGTRPDVHRERPLPDAHAVARCLEQKPKLAALDNGEDDGESIHPNPSPHLRLHVHPGAAATSPPPSPSPSPSRTQDGIGAMRECALSISISNSISSVEMPVCPISIHTRFSISIHLRQVREIHKCALHRGHAPPLKIYKPQALMNGGLLAY
ncbi:hypothetical protein B0H13DRAFT_2343990 [Mycena leptocephala]|nr:hypothetical protein B0H13DRAFT_2343990 [Mycena leptocephala]